MLRIIMIVLFIIFLTSCANSQNSQTPRLVGGPCEGCEAIFEYGNKKLYPVDTLPNFENSEPKLKITGTVYEKDFTTPAENVILYIYHTNRQGIYETKGDEQGWARRHGYIRGWVKTGKDGKYTFYTFRPAAYPDGREPEHIHIIVLEPDGKYYWIEDFHFDGDPLLSEKEKNPKSPRSGHSGLMKLIEKTDYLVVERNIVLGKNIPGYR